MPVLKKNDASNSKASMNDENIHTILGAESAFEGKLVFNSGRVRIDGKFDGEIHTENTLIIGESARVQANVSVGNIVITGEVIGDIRAKHSVAIERPGKLKGTIHTPELMIEKGVIFEGQCQMEDTEEGGTITLLSAKDDVDVKEKRS